VAVKAQPFFLVKYQQGSSTLHTHMCRTEPQISEKWEMYTTKIMNDFHSGLLVMKVIHGIPFCSGVFLLNLECNHLLFSVS